MLLIVMIAFVFSASVAFAGELTATNGKHKFDKEWKTYKEDGSAKITYGFNKVAVDEDFVWAKHGKKSHYASIYQKYNKKWYTGKSVKKGKTSKLEIKHRGSTVKYRCSW